MCFMHPFLEPELRILGTNTSSYIKYLQGKLQDDHMKKINYDAVTISLKDYVDGASIFLLDGNRFPMQLDDIYVSLRTDMMKCFTIDISFIKDKLINAFQLEIRNSVFPICALQPSPPARKASAGRQGCSSLPRMN